MFFVVFKTIDVLSIDADRSKKLGFDEFIQSDPCKFDHHDLFKTLQTATLDFRLNDPYCSLVNITMNILFFFEILKIYVFLNNKR